MDKEMQWAVFWFCVIGFLILSITDLVVKQMTFDHELALAKIQSTYCYVEKELPNE